MEIQEIESMLARRDSLTEAEKQMVVHAIYKNTEANEIAQRGALVTGNYGLLANLQWNKKEK